MDEVYQFREKEALILDLDSPNADTYGKQEDAIYNSHYDIVDFNPLVAFDCMTSKGPSGIRVMSIHPMVL